LAFTVSKSVVTRDVQDHVRPSGFSFAHSSIVRAFWMLNVSSSKKNSFTSGHICLAFAISAATSSLDRFRHGCPLNVCGHKQNVHCAGHPRVVYSDTYGFSRKGTLYFVTSRSRLYTSVTCGSSYKS